MPLKQRTAAFSYHHLSVVPRQFSSYQVLAVLGVLGPEEILRIERFRLVLTLAQLGDKALWHTLAASAGWAQVALDAATSICPGCPNGLVPMLQWVSEHHRQCQLAVTAFRRRSLTARANMRPTALAHARWLKSLHSEGGTSFQLHSDHEQQRFTCAVCGTGCSTKAALAAHCSKAHGIRAEAAHIGGTACLCCATEFWTTPRLRLHLRKQEQCLLAHLGSDIDYSAAEYIDVPACQRKPAVKVPIARPFWATLRPGRLLTSDPTPVPAVPMLLRCLRASEPATIFRDLVLWGVDRS